MNNTIARDVGLSFLGGYQCGFITGALVGLSNARDELPMVQLNQTLNTATYYGNHIGYTAAMTVTLFEGTKMLTKKAQLSPTLSTTLAGGVTGAFLATKTGLTWKRAAGGGIAGMIVAAAVSTALEKNHVLK